MIKAYKKAKRKTEGGITIGQSQQELFSKERIKYNKQCDRIENKYAYLNDRKIIDKKLAAIHDPYVIVKSHKQIYKWIGYRDNNYLLLDEHNTEKLYNGKYFIYQDKNTIQK